MSAVSVRDVSVAFGQHRVFDGMSLDIEAGEFIVLLGPSGCGKSTLLNAIAGLLDINEGQIHIGGRNVTWEEPKDRGIAMVFQSYALYPRMSVRENMSFGLRMAKTPKPAIDAKVSRAADMLQISHLLDRRPDQLSGGQRQRVAIGRALVRDADVFLFDEPLSNLDAQLRNELRVEIKRLHQQMQNTTMIYVTHDQIEALTLADRIAVMKDQKIQQLGTPAEIYHHPANLFVAGFVGSPRMNFIEGTVQPGDGAPVFTAPGILQPLSQYRFREPVRAPMPATLGVRPEHVRVNTPDAQPGFRVDLLETHGADNLMWCANDSLSLQIRLPGTISYPLGTAVSLAFDADQLSLFGGEDGERL